MLLAIVVDDEEFSLLNGILHRPVHSKVCGLGPPPTQSLLGEICVHLAFYGEGFVDPIDGSLGAVGLSLKRAAVIDIPICV
jgi:hypothetical protein